ncbi:MAG TPA: methionyl-tRNA formyltransferase [Verrucomicrobiae bacterium]|nr:methionyl-tRNA formyltransferase [Verrucomicrobiae bacterium]
MSKTILFFGNERLATGVTTTTPALRALIDAGYDVGGVVIAQAELARSRRARPLEVAATAEAHGIPVLAPDNLIEAKGQLAAYQADAAVLIAYGKIVPPEVLELFPAGIVNIHPSLLPLHRGSTPIESAILDGASETGVSLMKLSKKMDAGPLYDQVTVTLDGRETKQDLADRLADVGTALLLKHLPAILDGSARPAAQNDAEATTDQHISKADGLINWTKPAARLEHEVRAYAGWPRSRTGLGKTDVIITGAHAADGTGSPGTRHIEGMTLNIYCGEGMLVIDRLIPAGKREMTAAAFLAGYDL